MSGSLYKYRGDINRDLLTIINNQIYAPKRIDLNDPIDYSIDDSELKYDAGDIKVIDFLKNDISIYSMSYNFSNVQMWSYYANGHRGMCVEYDYDVFYEHFKDMGGFFAGKVLYVKEPITIKEDDYKKLLNGNRQELLKFTMAKSSYWEKEEEFRMCFKSDGLVDIPENAVTSIYFGVFMSDDDRIKIMKSLKNRNIRYFQMKLKNKSFELENEEIFK